MPSVWSACLAARLGVALASLWLGGCRDDAARPGEDASVGPPSVTTLSGPELSALHVRQLDERRRRAANPEVGRSAECTRVRSCLRERLPAVYRPETHDDVVKLATTCVTDLYDQGRCLPLMFGKHATNERPVELTTTSSRGGCIVFPILSISYTGVNDRDCACLGLRDSARRGHTCLVLPGIGRRRYGGGIGGGDWSELPDDDVARATGLLDRMLLAVDSRPVDAMTKADAHALYDKLASQPPKTLTAGPFRGRAPGLHVDYRAIPDAQWLARLLAGVAPTAFARALERACPARGRTDVRLTISVHGEVAFAELDATCEHPVLSAFELLERELVALPPPTQCSAVTLPVAGLQCLPGVGHNDFVLLRRADRQLHALDQTLVDITCATVRERLLALTGP